ncbi:CRTAC1 family protein [Marinicella sp. W31]|uniref:CRTAC1 family protein n=1 Tax=Marinicella sp. W31 TaxID=3023713 RepID=UPI0037571FFE
MRTTNHIKMTSIRNILILITAFISSSALAQSHTFTDVTDRVNIDVLHSTSQDVVSMELYFENEINHLPELSSIAHLLSSWITGGVTAGDYDGDGWYDLFVLGGDMGTSKLFRNMGNGSFTDVTVQTGLSQLSGRMAGAIFADYDGDGDQDLFIGGALGQKPRLMRNDLREIGIFVDVFDSAFSGFDIQSSPNTWGAAFGDYDNDHCLDLFMPHSMTPSGPSPTLYSPGGSTQHLWKGNCQGQFIDTSISSGITPLFEINLLTPNQGRDETFSANFADINNDGFSDILVAGDTGSDLVLLNQQNGQFTNVVDYTVVNDLHAMGMAVGDFNNDGNIDWFTSNIGDPNPGNKLYYGNGDGSFVNDTERAGVGEGHWGWGSCALDINLDRHLDIYHVNGFYNGGNGNPDAPSESFSNTPAVLFLSRGNGEFNEVAESLNLNDSGEGRGVSCFDFDRDGDIDIAISNHKGAFKLYRNDLAQPNRNFINVKLEGLPPNTAGLGSRVYLTSNNPNETGEYMREIRASNNFVSSNTTDAHFGLGDWQGPFHIRVEWLHSQTSEIHNVSKNQFLTITAIETPIFVNGFE